MRTNSRCAAYPGIISLISGSARVCARLRQVKKVQFPQRGASEHKGTIVSLNNPTARRIIFGAIEETSNARHHLRNDIFKQIVQSRKLQDQILAVLAKHPGTQRRMVVELAKDAQMRRKLLKLVCRQTEMRSGS